MGKFASGLFSVRSDGTGLGTIVAPTTFVIANPRWSPKGDRLSYTSLAVDHSTPARPHIVDADGTNDRILGSFAEDETGGLPNLWSNDGTRLLIGRCHRPSVDDTGCDLRYSIVAVDGLGPEQMIADGILDFGDSSQAWAPDDSYIVASTSQGEPNGDSALGHVERDDTSRHVGRWRAILDATSRTLNDPDMPRRPAGSIDGSHAA